MYAGLILLLLAPNTAVHALTLAWNAATGLGIAGYRLYYGRGSRLYTKMVNVGNTTTTTVSGLTSGATYYFAVTAYNILGLESIYSQEIAYTVPAATLPGSIPPAGQAGYVTGQTLGTIRNNYSGFVGMKIVVGSSPIAVTALGRMMATGNSGSHTLKLVNASDGTDVAGATALIRMGAASSGQFQYTNLTDPVVLEAGKAYYVLSQELVGGDNWYNYDTLVKTSPVATETSAAWGYGVGQWFQAGGNGQSYVPVDFWYSTDISIADKSYVTNRTLGTTHNDFSGYLGMQFAIGSAPVTVTALGRLMASGNSGTHLLKLVRANDGSDVPGAAANVSMTGGSVGQNRYARLSNPVTLSAGTTYYLLSQETAGGDLWYNNDTLIKTTAVALESSGIWGYGDGQWFSSGGVGQAYGPLDFKYLNTAQPTPQAFLTGQTLGGVYNSFSGFLGMKITVGSNPVSVTALGRIVLSGNTGTHTLKLVNAADGLDVAGGSVSLSASGGTAGRIKYADLKAPILLPAGGSYYVLSQETSGGDTWYSSDTVVSTTSAAAVVSGAWGYGVGQWYPGGTANHAYGPVDLKYLIAAP